MGDLTKNLSRHEFACECGCGFDTVDYKLVEILQAVVDHFSSPRDTHENQVRIHISSGNRCKEHNANTPGAAENSQHIHGKAADFWLYRGSDPYSNTISNRDIARHIESRYSFISVGRYKNRTHIDTRILKGVGARWIS